MLGPNYLSESIDVNSQREILKQSLPVKKNQYHLTKLSDHADNRKWAKNVIEYGMNLILGTSKIKALSPGSAE